MLTSVFKIDCKKGRGISFIDKDGVKLINSKIDRKFFLKGIERIFSYEEQKNVRCEV